MRRIQPEFLPQELKNEMANEGRGKANGEVRNGENINKGRLEGLRLSRGAAELAHKEIGIEEEDDEADFDESPQNRRGATWLVGTMGHEFIVRQ